jgi:hypothetical protein
MTTANCIPINARAGARELELRPDRLADLLECLAEAGESTHDAIQRLVALEDALKRLGLEAAAVHQLLQHEHLI